MSYSIAGRSKSSFFFPLNPHSFKLCLYLGVYRLYRAALLTLDLNYQPLNWRRKWQPAPVFLPGESRDGGAWWAVVSGVAQSWTRLKRLSSRSSINLWTSFVCEKNKHILFELLLLFSACGPTSSQMVCNIII